MNKRIFFVAAIVLGLRSSSPVPAQTRPFPLPDSLAGRTIVDANGKFVGNLLGENVIELKINGIWVLTSKIQKGAFIPNNPSQLRQYFTTSDCTGQAYMEAAALPVNGIIATFGANPTVFYPGTPKYLTIFSVKYGYTSLVPLTGGTCWVPFPSPLWGGPTTVHNLSGFVAPFSIK